MAESPTPPADGGPAASGSPSAAELLLSGVGLVYLAAGVVFGVVFVIGDVTTSLFPTGWVMPAIMVITGALMTLRRRFDIAIALWGSLTLAVFLLDMDIYMRGLDLRLVDPAAFDPTIIAGALTLLVLVLRPAFRD
jgi:hypothetical protein